MTSGGIVSADGTSAPSNGLGRSASVAHQEKNGRRLRQRRATVVGATSSRRSSTQALTTPVVTASGSVTAFSFTAHRQKCVNDFR
jgi:hypothetical protein